VRSSRRITATALVGATAIVLTATGCSTGSGDGGGSGGGGGEPITLTVTTFNTMGFEDLYTEYEEANPNIKIEAQNIDTGGNARTDTFTKLAAGSGLSDVTAIEEGWLGSIMEVSDQFSDLNDFDMADRKGDWLPWKVDQVTDADDRVIGYGTDVGPEGLCINGPALEAGGIPSERAAFAEALGGDDATWESYFDLGRQYHAATGKAWFDHSGFVWNAMVNQLDEGYYTADGELNIEGNAELEALWAQLASAVDDGLSGAQTAWDWNEGKSFTDQTFATFMCPGWMLGNIKGSLEQAGGDASTGWDFADVFPGGPANWGGSWLTVPTTSEHPEEAAALASWLTEPEQQVKAFAVAGTFPSTTSAQEELASAATPNPLFNDAPIGTILAERAVGVKAQFKGPDDSLIQENVFGPALQSLDRGDVDGDGAWDKAMQLLDELVK
jgi:cellobiose transport system substrate-binding protein